ncbi:Hint domain-containing protein [Donghicola sp. C2-DW-16]|uniref:Hint domain-containing protein n=1 Tax=Donghicola mangrovi TaxID=2729614 RepID=A0A850Q4I3_9RHOB|nr:Hint domain-containing protein [Donghicola mangrovi]NVO23863.1 Hint domain-containing protein [Donghicola mangrovi]NVO27397.1 Hint domain-containing protein [Donghicola mangrovi]
MGNTPRATSLPPQSLPVFRSEQFLVVSGANMGDTLSFADDLTLDDVYCLEKGAPQRLSILPQERARATIAPDTEVGTAGNLTVLDSCITLMSPRGDTTEALILVELDPDSDVQEVYLLPLARLVPGDDYTLVGISKDDAAQKLAQVACVAFSRGTHITLASGKQAPIETLKVGDRVLTRDSGIQQIRWIGQTTVRAAGAFAPIVITAGTLNNEHDLIVSPEHRLFIYQRQDRLGTGRSEVLIKARHLVNGDTIHWREGGFVDYFQLLFDEHQIIYAEGIAAETLLLDLRTEAALPEDIIQSVGDAATNAASATQSMEVPESVLRNPDILKLIRSASSG